MISSKYNTDLLNWERQLFLKIISTDLTVEQKNTIINPAQRYNKQKYLVAVHWHPEYIPLGLIRQRIDNMFPNKIEELVIPTQHNTILKMGEYSGVEVDCYSHEFNRKVQLLLHFKSSRLQDATALKDMIKHTFKYRSKQLFEIIHLITSKSMDERLNEVIIKTGSSKQVVEFVKINTEKFIKLFNEYRDEISPDMVKNKLMRNYFDELRQHYDNHFIDLCQIFIRGVKSNVKSSFSNKYFYKTQEIIEETRANHGCIIVPHPEQFWPILLAEYDVDGYEVWNPQSQEYTEFLIKVVNGKNKTSKYKNRPLLLFMGDDTHMSEKIRPVELQNPEKAEREIGVQPLWYDMKIRKSLIVGNGTIGKVIEDYKLRLE